MKNEEVTKEPTLLTDIANCDIGDADSAEMCKQIMDTAVAVSKRISAATALHDPAGSCHDLTKQMLESYRSLRYGDLYASTNHTAKSVVAEYDADQHVRAMLSAEDREALESLSQEEYYFSAADIIDALQMADTAGIASNALTRLFGSVRINYEAVLVTLLDSALEIIRKRGKNGPGLARVLEATYYSLETEGMTRDQIATELDMTLSSYFKKLNTAVTNVSILLFGLLATRYKKSPYYISGQRIDANITPTQKKVRIATKDPEAKGSCFMEFAALADRKGFINMPEVTDFCNDVLHWGDDEETPTVLELPLHVIIQSGDDSVTYEDDIILSQEGHGNTFKYTKPIPVSMLDCYKNRK